MEIQHRTICLSLLLAIYAHADIIVTRPPENTAGRVGTVIQVNCSTTLTTGQTLEWWFNGAGSTQDELLITATPSDVLVIIQGYRADSQLNLIIENLDFTKAGKYTCQLREQGSPPVSYPAEVIALGELSLDAQDVLEGEHVTVTCGCNISGIFNPRIRMFDEDGQLETYEISEPSAPDGEFRINKYGYNFTAMDYHNDLQFMCDLMFIGEDLPSFIAVAYFNATVFHGVMDIAIKPNSDNGQVPSVQVGEHLNCSARGEPEPEYRWSDVNNSTDVRNGSSLLVTSDMIGRNEFMCTAYNYVNGTYHDVNKTVVFNAVEHSDNGSSAMLPSFVLSIVLAVFFTIVTS